MKAIETVSIIKVLLLSLQAKQQATCREQLAEAEAQHQQRCHELEERGIQWGGRVGEKLGKLEKCCAQIETDKSCHADNIGYLHLFTKNLGNWFLELETS